MSKRTLASDDTWTMSKRSSTSNISDESPTILSSVSSSLSSNDTQASIETDNTPSLHYIRQTFLGPICAKCNTKISSLGTLFTISRQTIIRHWKANNCYIGDIKKLNAKEVENNLRMSIVQLYNTIRNNPTLASKHVRAHFHCKTTFQSPYCSRCGYVGKAENVRRHINSDACNCTSNEAKISEGKVLMDKYNFSIPQQVLDTISSGMFELPFDQFTNTIIMVQKSNDAETNSSTSSLQSPSALVLHKTMFTSPAKFVPLDEEIEDICSPHSKHDDVTSIDSFAMAELLNCFGDEDNAKKARDYLTSFILFICQQSPGELKNTLYSIGTMMSSSPSDLNLKLLLNAGKCWLTSNSANMDVRMVPVHLRNAIYLVGNTFTDKDMDLLKGCTFVWSDCIDSILQQFTSLLTYAHASQCPLIEPYLAKVNRMYQLLLQNNTTNLDVEELESLVATKIVNSTIIFGLLLDLLLEQPTHPNGPNCMYHYLAGGCVIACTKSKKLSLRSSNGISRNANACLRLLRHGVCSLYVRQSMRMTQEMKLDADLQSWANDILRQMQVSSSVGHICRTIRMARDVDRKTPSSVYKAFNDLTGDLVVDGNEIFKSSWSVAIPTACQEWDKHLLTLFPDHASSSSALPLNLVFNLANHIILAEEESCIYIDNTSDECFIPLSAFKPTFVK